MNVMDWKEAIDAAGATAPLSALENLLSNAPHGADQTNEYHYLQGLVHGRAIHEELGGL